MKRYLLFSYETYYPSGGWNDFDGDFDTIEEAKSAFHPTFWKDGDKDASAWHGQIIDSRTGKEILGWGLYEGDERILDWAEIDE